ncbi:2'-deoxynucleoside 5'-phosphate n-hydrolase 1 [Anaeramoeba flamelloides]|uniref:2'-deoxynucleoside 5'-phosphate n-hydrolase n=1 Tax=Anaeramoeba flamelloides TaxID=1746091 RepID=A0AAV7Y9N6_9EUKA|nr:2'-deoxynucleoside 5'-phosphate n-hydrolase [Anaeramoeba flamelloides]KAJ6236817.1 2'-deoxynucleoside 5'-phosphate n-hydrolase 1 [Anaeramoeba flamelloides]
MTKQETKYFLAGVMQKNNLEGKVCNQNYRSVLTKIIEENDPMSSIYDPWAAYDPDENLSISETFLGNIEKAGEADITIAFIPEASMGTACEIYRAKQMNKTIWAITPLKKSWVMISLCNEIFESIEEFTTFFKDLQNQKKN